MMALAVTGAGGLALLAGVVVLGHITGNYELDATLAASERIRGHALYPVALILILVGALTKSAQLPFHFWLPRAMAAPPCSSLARIVGDRALVLARQRSGPFDLVARRIRRDVPARYQACARLLYRVHQHPKQSSPTSKKMGQN